MSLQSVRPSEETPEHDALDDSTCIGCFIVVYYFHARDPTKGFHMLENEPLRYIHSPLFLCDKVSLCSLIKLASNPRSPASSVKML